MPAFRRLIPSPSRSMTLSRSKPPLTEQDIHAALWQHVAWRAAPDAFVFHVPNGGARSKTEAAIFSGLGVVPGVPDIIAIRGGKTFALELKRDDGRLSPAQRLTHDRMKAAGAAVAVAYGLDEALCQLESWGILRGRADIRT